MQTGPTAESESQPASDQEGEERDVDHVEEPEEPAIGLEDPLGEDSSDDEEVSTDPFDTHFAHPDEELSSKRVQAVKKGEWASKRAVTKPWRATYMYPGSEDSFTAPSSVSHLDDLRLKNKLKETASRKMAEFGDIEKGLAPILFGYRDVLYCDRTVKDSESLRRMVCLHALNHVFK